MSSQVAGGGDPVDTAQAFISALAWNEHTTVWDLLSPAARAAVLDLATRRGMDALLAARLREGTTGHEERDEFLADLLRGLRRAMPGVDFEALRCVRGGSGATVACSVLVHLVVGAPAELGGDVPVGRIELVADVDGRWSVVRLDGTR